MGGGGGRRNGSRADAHRPERLVRPLPVGLDRSSAGPAVSSVRPSMPSSYPKTLVLRDMDVADQVFSFISTAERLVEAGPWSR